MAFDNPAQTTEDAFRAMCQRYGARCDYAKWFPEEGGLEVRVNGEIGFVFPSAAHVLFTGAEGKATDHAVQFDGLWIDHNLCQQTEDAGLLPIFATYEDEHGVWSCEDVASEAAQYGRDEDAHRKSYSQQI